MFSIVFTVSSSFSVFEMFSFAASILLSALCSDDLLSISIFSVSCFCVVCKLKSSTFFWSCSIIFCLSSSLLESSEILFWFILVSLSYSDAIFFDVSEKMYWEYSLKNSSYSLCSCSLNKLVSKGKNFGSDFERFF